MGVAEHWIRFGADGWRLDVPDEIDDDEFWREFRRRVKAVNPEAYIVAEIWRLDPDVLRGDMYDALMNYPLGAAALSFAGTGHIDRAVADTHAGVGAFVHDDDGPAFVRRLAEAIDAYPPEVAAAQLNLIDSHDTPRALTICSGDTASMRLATLVQMTVPGAPSHLLRRRDRAAGRLRPGLPAGLSLGSAGGLGSRPPRVRHGGHRTCATSTRCCASGRSGSAARPAPSRPTSGSGEQARCARRPQQWPVPASISLDLSTLTGTSLHLLRLPGDDGPVRSRDPHRRPPPLPSSPCRPGRAASTCPEVSRVDRHARLGQERRLLPGLPGPVRPERAGTAARARSSRGTRRRPTTASRAATSTAWPTASTTWPTSGSPRSTSTRSSRRHRTTATTRTTTSQVDPLLGGNDALRELLDRAHAKGIRVVLDGVFNHASRGFWPFNHVLECGIGSPYLDWFHVDREALAAGRPLRAYPDESLRHAFQECADGAGPLRHGVLSVSATRPGGTCRRFPSSTPTTRRSAST